MKSLFFNQFKNKIGGFMYHKIHRFKAYFVLLFAVVLFFGYYSSETINDPDRIEAENLIDAGIAPVLTELNTNAVLDLNTAVLLDNRTNTEPVFSFSVADTLLLPANPGPANNGGSPNWAIFMDFIAGTRDIEVTQMTTANAGGAGVPFTVQVFTRLGTSFGGPVGSGPGSSTAGWTSIGTVPAIQGPVANGISELFTLPTINVPAGDTIGVAMQFAGVGPRYFGTGTPPISNYMDTNLTLRTGEVRSAPFTPTGSWFSSRALVGEVRYVVSTTTGVVNINTEIPNGFNLSQNYPNPFNPSTTIEFAIPDKSDVSLRIFNIHGQEVKTLAGGNYPAGTYRVNWDATGFASGVYFYSIQAGSFSQTKKLLLVK
jgi:hypothetical protein